MPELPEVETVRRGLLPILVGRRIATVIQRREDLRFPLPTGFTAHLAGRRVAGIDRRGKYLLIELEGSLVWIVHLGMSGRFLIDQGAGEIAGEGGFGPHDHVVLLTDEGARLRFCDPRRFGFMDLTAAEAIGRHPMLAALGPDPFGDAFTPDFLAGELARRRSPLKAALLDQRLVAGMGNIYASESLFHARLAPERIASTVSRDAASRLIIAIRRVFAAAIAAGGSSLRDHRQPSGELGFFQTQFAVYGRAGKPCPGCRCTIAQTGGIRRIVQSGRATFYCGKRQR